MEPRERAIAIVGVSALLPDAASAEAFWRNLLERRSSIRETPAGRWSVADYYDPDPSAPDKTYSKVGGWVEGFAFDWKRFHIPPRVASAMDQGQQWAIQVAAAALEDYGYPSRPLDLARTGVVLGAAMGGERHYETSLRIAFPEYARALSRVETFAGLPEAARRDILERWHEVAGQALPPVTEDTMPGELTNILAGRVANVLDLHGPSFTTDAACASSLAALEASMALLEAGQCDAVLTGGLDRNMGVTSFVKFCKIGALSATGSRPFGDGADGFVMGEGAALFLVKRLADAERDGDRIYAVVRGIGASSDGRGKGITAPNPAGQRLAIERAWQDAGLDPASATLVEAHGTSTRVGDVVEVESLASVFGGAPKGAIALGSAKSNIGHLKAAAGAAGLLKATLALHHKVLPPTLNAERPNPGIDFGATPFAVNHEAREWTRNGHPRRCGVSAYGFGGTNFHVVLEEHLPGAREPRRRARVEVPEARPGPAGPAKAPPRGVLALGAESPAGLAAKLEGWIARVKDGAVPPPACPDARDLACPERVVVDYGSGPELLDRLQKASRSLAGSPAAWKALASQGIHRGTGPCAGKVAFLFPGQGSQYVNMARRLAASDREVRAVFEEADRVSAPALGRPLTGFIFVDGDDPASLAAAEEALKQTAITQPAVLAVDVAIDRLLRSYGLAPDLLMGHSLGEYAALVAAGVLPFAEAIEASMARGREMTNVALSDNGAMAAVMAPRQVIDATLANVPGYVVAANLNSGAQCVIGGATGAVREAVKAFRRLGYTATRIPVSHAFHTRIVSPASAPLRKVLDRFQVAPPRIPLVGNVTGELYPHDPDAIKDLLERQIASPVLFSKGLETLYAEGARVFVEVGPKRVLKGFVDDVLASRPDVVSLSTNHPKPGDVETFNQALCGLWAAGFGAVEATSLTPAVITKEEAVPAPNAPVPPGDVTAALLRALESLRPERPALDRNEPPRGSIVISGTGLGLPGVEKPVMDPGNAQRILAGEPFVDLVPSRFRDRLAARQVTRLVKGEDGSGHFETIDDPSRVIKLAGRPGRFDLTEEYGVPASLVEALDATAQLAMAAGLDALREAGIPLVQTWKTTTTGRRLPDRWLLPEPLRDETGVIFASAFPGLDRFADELERFHAWEARQQRLLDLNELRRSTGDPGALAAIARKEAELTEALRRDPYTFDRRFLFRVLSMGHSQLAEYVGARGPNTQVNSACASTALAIAIAEDWIRAGRCRRVLVIGADDVTGERLFPWIGAGFLASGAAATDDRVEDAALPFDRRRHGTLLGMGACALLVEAEDAAAERGVRGIVEVLSTELRNSAFHGTRLDVEHIAAAMESLVSSAERRFGVSRLSMAPRTVFVSHETFTPARGGSAAAEVAALRRTFGDAAREVVVANTKGFTGHPMGVGIEDVIGVKILEHGVVPPVPNLKEPDPELGVLNLSRGGRYPVDYAIHLAAGFGSQIALTLTRRVPGGPERVESRARYTRWLADVTGHGDPGTEVVKRVLRVRAEGPPERPPVPSSWTYGLGPVRRAAWSIGASADAAPPDLARPPAHAARPAEAPGVAAGPVANAAPSGGPATPVSPPAVVSRPVAASAPVVAAPPDPEPAPQPAVPAPALVAPAEAQVRERVLAIVAEKTGYPPEMLDMELDLEADLGVDTVKQAEVFASVRGEYGIPRRENVRLRDFPTLAHVVRFVLESRPELAAPSAPTAPEPEPVLALAGVSAASAAARAGAAHEVAPSPVRRELPAPSPIPAAPPDGGPFGAPRPPLPDGDDAVARVLEIVAAKTGYPTDMLELDLDLEADLGVDTVKQAEVFSEVRAAFGIPRQENLRLREFPTLRHVVGFVRDRRPAAPPAAAPVPPAPSPRVAPVAADLAAADRLPRRVPVPVLRPPLAVLKPTGVTLGAGSRVVVAGDPDGAGAALAARLEALGATVLRLDPALPAERIDALAAEWSATPLTGVYWLTALEAEPAPDELEPAAFHELCRVRVKSLHALMRRASPDEAAPVFLVSATRLGGYHGYDEAGAPAALGGGVTGYTKAFHRERAAALVKAVDFGAGMTPEEIAAALVEETLLDPGAVEIGRALGRRFTVALEERPAEGNGPGVTLSRETVFVVTGAAGGITSAIVADLAAASGGSFHLLDVVPEPRRDDPAIALFRSDREALKRRLADELRAAGERVTPVAVEKRLFAIERLSSALAAIEAVEAAGGLAVYHSVNLLDAGAVDKAMAEVKARHGRVDVLLHAAGIEISRALVEKPMGELDLVFDIKAGGLAALLWAVRDMPLGAAVLFSSIAGRFGNAGQVDYSAANDLLCKVASAMRRSRPATRAVAIDWTAWAGLGMATRGSIPRVMEAAGIEMLPPEVGIPTVRRELTAGVPSAELVVGGALGSLLRDADESGGLDPACWRAALEAAGSPVMLGGQASLTGGVLTVETTLDPVAEPFLRDHAIDGTPVLPGVMGLEAFAELATLLTGSAVGEIADARFLLPFKFHRGRPATLHLSAVARPSPDGSLAVEARLESILQPKPELPKERRLHFTARLLVRPAPAGFPAVGFPELPGAMGQPLPDGARAIGSEAIYRAFFHGPAYRVLEGVSVASDAALSRMALALPPEIGNGGRLMLAPRVVELAFQTAGIWEMATREVLALPAGFRSLRFHDTTSAGALFAHLFAREGEGVDVTVADGEGRAVLELLGYVTSPLPGRVTVP